MDLERDESELRLRSRLRTAEEEHKALNIQGIRTDVSKHPNLISEQVCGIFFE